MFVVAAQGPDEAVVDDSAAVGQRLRAAREALGLSLREVARRLEISASALSQIETGKSRPSVKTLYAIVSELGLSMDQLFAANPPNAEPTPARPARATAPGSNSAAPPAFADSVMQPANSRASLQLDSGVTWERLTGAHDPNVDFLFTTYDVGGSSSGGDKLVRHSGREYGIVLSGELEVTVGFETYRLGPGDSCSFDSNEPHRLSNPGDVPTTAIWVVIGRRQSDPRSPSFGAE
jgi:transcriptional regulator with XRE-family HTH domain